MFKIYIYYDKKRYKQGKGDTAGFKILMRQESTKPSVIVCGNRSHILFLFWQGSLSSAVIITLALVFSEYPCKPQQYGVQNFHRCASIEDNTSTHPIVMKYPYS